MKGYRRFWFTVFALAALLSLAACGGSGGDAAEETRESNGGMAGMHHGSESMASEMLMENGEYSDERFIDAMVPHHQGAVEMAEVARENAEHEEINRLSEEVIVAQRDEIEELKSIKEAKFGTSEVPMEMSPEEMNMMGMVDSQQLAEQRPFDRAFIDAMIPHHQSAIEMSRVAFEQSENPNIRALAETIIDAQTQEIEQMTAWREEWYPEG